MDRLNALGRGTKLMFIASVLLLIISFFNWQEVDFDLGPLGSGSAGVSAWDDIGGIIMGILTIVLIARIVARAAAVDVPIPVSFAMTSVLLGVLIFIIALLKNLTDTTRRGRATSASDSLSSSPSARGSRRRTPAGSNR